jgi:hypothetical protein
MILQQQQAPVSLFRHFQEKAAREFVRLGGFALRSPIEIASPLPENRETAKQTAQFLLLSGS